MINNLGKNKPAVIINANYPMAFTVLRDLGRCGIPVHGIFGRPGSRNSYQFAVRSSRYLKNKVYFDEADYQANAVSALIKLGRTLGKKAVLFSLSDEDMEMVSKHRERLKPYYRFLLPDHDMILDLLYKDRFAALARRKKLPVPETWVYGGEKDIKILKRVKFPCLIKPPWRDKKWISHFGPEKVVRINHYDELVEKISLLKSEFLPLVIQELIGGRDSNIVCSFLYLDERSNPVHISLCRKLRQNPPFFGDTSMAEHVKDEEAAAFSKNVCRKLQLTGYISIESKKDQSDGQYKILEITPARLNRNLGASTYTSVSLVNGWYDFLIGRNGYCTNGFVKKGRWISEAHEFRSVPRYLASGDLKFADLLQSYRGVKKFEVLAGKDIVPFVIFILSAFYKMVKKKYSLNSNN